MSRVRHIYTDPQTINQVWFGESKAGTIPNSGGLEVITDETHDVDKLGQGDVGGPMVLHRNIRRFSLGTCFKGAGSGSQVAIHPSFYRAGADEPFASTLYAYGGTAIARTLPTNPAVDVADIFAQSIQYKQALPKAMGASLWKERAAFFKAINPKTFSEEYLNYAFGWLPFLSDIHDVMHAVINSHEYLAKLRKGSDVKTRVGYHFEPTSSNPSDSPPAYVYSVDSELTGWGAGEVTYSSELLERIWFKGCYTYHVPVDPSHMSKLTQYSEYAKHVLGIRPTVEAVWDAAPWSWAIDWAANVGDVAHNISAFSRDGLILQYGYIMSQTLVKENWYAPGGDNCSSCNTQSISEWKVRYPASPYGFGLTYEALTVSQKAILAAIGITHFK